MRRSYSLPLRKKQGRENNQNQLALSLSQILDEWFADLYRDETVTAEWVAEYVLNLSSTAVSQYRSEKEPDRNLPAWALLKITRKMNRLDLLQAMLSTIGVEVSWRDQDAAGGLQAGDLNALLGLLALDNGKVVNAFLQATSPTSPGGAAITDEEMELLVPFVHHLRRIAADVDDRISLRRAAGGES